MEGNTESVMQPASPAARWAKLLAALALLAIPWILVSAQSIRTHIRYGDDPGARLPFTILFFGLLGCGGLSTAALTFARLARNQQRAEPERYGNVSGWSYFPGALALALSILLVGGMLLGHLAGSGRAPRWYFANNQLRNTIANLNLTYDQAKAKGATPEAILVALDGCLLGQAESARNHYQPSQAALGERLVVIQDQDLEQAEAYLKSRALDLGSLVFGVKLPAHGKDGFIIGVVKVRKGGVEEFMAHKTSL